MDDLQTLEEALADALCELEEANECGDLEDRFTLSQHVSDLEARIFRAKLQSTGSS